MISRVSLVVFCAALALLQACGSSETRYGTDAALPQDRARVAYARIEIATVGLPAYAETEEIQAQGADGAIQPVGGLWADTPTRAVTLQVARDLGALTGGIVAPAPWPFRDPPAARVDIRIETYLATAEGQFVMTGQIFAAPEDGGRDRARRFDIAVDIAPDGGPTAIATAQGAAVTALTRDVAAALR